MTLPLTSRTAPIRSKKYPQSGASLLELALATMFLMLVVTFMFDYWYAQKHKRAMGMLVRVVAQFIRHEESFGRQSEAAWEPPFCDSIHKYNAALFRDRAHDHSAGQRLDELLNQLGYASLDFALHDSVPFHSMAEAVGLPSPEGLDGTFRTWRTTVSVEKVSANCIFCLWSFLPGQKLQVSYSFPQVCKKDGLPHEF